MELELSLRAGRWAIVALLLLLPLFHLQNGLQQVGEIAQARVTLSLQGHLLRGRGPVPSLRDSVFSLTDSWA